MEKNKTADVYYETEHHFQKAIIHLRELAKTTEAVETCKWGMPVYTINTKNVFGICRFKAFFGIWFYQGVFLKDSKGVLRNAQEGKTKAMRHWNFTSIDEIDDEGVLAYINEAIENQKQGKEVNPKKKSTGFTLPQVLNETLKKDTVLNDSFKAFSPYKQKEFADYIHEAKQEKTKLRRLEKILPLIKGGIGLNDAYRRST
jgi:uncharacterized protein YdeI (YjbR/CyaY-like superfamily)